MDFATGMIAPKGHQPFVQQQHFIAAPGRIELSEFTLAERIGFHCIQQSEQAPSARAFRGSQSRLGLLVQNHLVGSHNGGLRRCPDVAWLR